MLEDRVLALFLLLSVFTPGISFRVGSRFTFRSDGRMRGAGSSRKCGTCPSMIFDAEFLGGVFGKKSFEKIGAVESPTRSVEDAGKGSWISAIDPESGKEYFYDSVTLETRWESPIEQNPLASRYDGKQSQQKQTRSSSPPVEMVETVAFSKDKSRVRQNVKAFECSVAGRSGGKPKMNQDATLLCGLDYGINMFGIFDGHGALGQDVASWVVKNMPDAVNSALFQQDLSLAESVTAAFLTLDSRAGKEIGKIAAESGCTATLVLQQGEKFFAAWVGDSRAILGNIAEAGKVEALTSDHNPANPAERQRIEAAGGTVGVLEGEPDMAVSNKGRVFFPRNRKYPGLATARALGDFKNGKQVGVCARPDVRGKALPPAAVPKTVLILATDGVWDVVDAASAVAICGQYAAARDADMAATVLVQTSRMLWEARPGAAADIDDISAVVAFF